MKPGLGGLQPGVTSALQTPLTLGQTKLPHRVMMAPLTRMRASAGEVPNDLMADYYAQRSGASLIVSEGTQISPQAQGYMDTPGIHSAEQVRGWRTVTDAVHAAGGLIAAQLWHVGRISHDSLHGGVLPVSASALPHTNRTTLKDADGRPTRVPCPTPRALTEAEIETTIQDYAAATRNAREAGFDFVELHGAHGYLLHQFLSPTTNHRDDQWGGSLENRARLLLRALDAAIEAWDADHVGIRISPVGEFHEVEDPDGEATGVYLAEEFHRRGIAFLHLSEPDWAGGAALTDDFRSRLRAAFPGPIVAAGNYDVAKAERLLEARLIDAVAFGRAYIANPDLAQRLAQGAPLNPPVPQTFYGGGAEGYTDYPALAD